MKWKFKRTLVKLLRLNNTPPEIALGTAIGVFIAITPLYGFHTLMVIIAALLVRRANKIAILIGTNISLPPTLPFITWTAYDIGRFIIRNNYPPLSWDVFKKVTWERVRGLYFPLFIGSLILGAICGVIFYFLTYFVVKKLKDRKKNARIS